MVLPLNFYTLLQLLYIHLFSTDSLFLQLLDSLRFIPGCKAAVGLTCFLHPVRTNILLVQYVIIYNIYYYLLVYYSMYIVYILVLYIISSKYTRELIMFLVFHCTLPEISQFWNQHIKMENL